MDPSKDNLDNKKVLLDDMGNAKLNKFQCAGLNTISKYVRHAEKSKVSKNPVGKCLEKDSHGICKDDSSLKGASRYFNSSTIRGRANVAKLTLGAIAVFGIYKYLSTPAGHARG